MSKHQFLSPSKYLRAVESAKKFKYTPKQALDCKEFSALFWEWCHKFFIDTVKQYGYPSIFITISSSEGLFPKV